MSLETTLYLRTLRRNLVKLFDLDGLKVLGFDLGVDWEELPGEKLTTKAQSLITYLARHGRLQELIALLSEERPNVEWPQIPATNQQIEDIYNTEPESSGAVEYRRLLVEIEKNQQGKLPTPILREYLLEGFPKLDGKRKGRLLMLLNDLELLYTHRYVEETDRSYELREETPCQLAGADLTYANLQGAHLFNDSLWEKMVDVEGQFIAAPNFSKVDLRHANLKKANLNQAILDKASIRDANLQEANLSAASVIGTDFSGADLRGCDFSAVKGISDAIFKGAKYNKETRWPDDFNWKGAGAVDTDSS